MSQRINYRLYKPSGLNSLEYIKQGTCLAYIPETRKNGEPDSSYEHITVDLGDMQLMFDKASFKEFCKEVLGHTCNCKKEAVPFDGTVKLRIVK